MLAAIRAVAPEEATRLEKDDPEVPALKRFIYNYNYQVRAKYDSRVKTEDQNCRPEGEVGDKN